MNGNSSLFDIHILHKGKVSDKWERYLLEYDRIFSTYRDKKINLLEIGIQNGGSLEVWAKYFNNANLLIGCDIDKKCLNLKYDTPIIKVVVGDVTEKSTKKDILKYTNEFDIIVEDASHISNHIIKAFLDFFPKIKEGGIFVAEDLHCSYWDEWEGGLYHPYSSMAFFKLLTDIINFEHWGVDKKNSEILKGFADRYNLKIEADTLASIHSIEFINSMCIIKKQKIDENILGKRYISGIESSVSSAPMELEHQGSYLPLQKDNFWSTLEKNPNEEYFNLLETIKIKDKEIYESKTLLKEKMNEIHKLKTELQVKNQLVLKQESVIEENRRYINILMNSTSWKITHPIRVLSQGIQNFRIPRYQNLFIPHTKEYKYARAIKRRLPLKYSHKIGKLIKKSQKNNFKLMPWDNALSKISQNLGKQVLIIAELSIPQCKKYRVDQKIEMLQYLGYHVSVVSWTEYQQALNLLQISNIVIFYRVPAFDSVLDLFNEVERLGLISFYDVDDLIFDKEELKKNSNNLKLDDKVQKEIYKGADLYQLALSKCQHAIASTAVLGNYMKQHILGDVFIIPNCLDEELLSFVDSSKKSRNSDKINIVYGSGTSTHDSDFLEATEALLKILDKYSHVELVIHGILNLPKEFDKYTSQIQKIPVMSANDYYASLNRYDINIAPLEQTVFNDAKSNIKFLEASIFKLPTVASPSYEFKNVIQNADNGYVASSTSEWFQALEQLVLDPSLRDKIGQNAFNTVMIDYRIESVATTKMKPLIESFISTKKDQKQRDILMVNILFQPISFGGATIVVEEISKYINQIDNYNVTVFTGLWDSQKRAMGYHDIVRYEANNLPIIGVKFPVPMTPELEYQNSKMKARFLNVLESLQPDIVHFHSIQQLSASLVEACLELDIPYIITLHDMWWLCEQQFMVMENNQYCAQEKVSVDFCISKCTKNKDFTVRRDNYLRPLLYRANLLLTPSKFQSTMYSSDEISPENILVNKNGILFPKEDFKKSRRVESRLRFAYLGGNAVHKGYNWLKEIFESLPQDNYDLTVVDLHKKLGSFSIEENSWKIGGRLIISDGYEYGQAGLDDFFKDIDVLLFPSQWKESFGLTIREALVRDVWVISTDAGGVIEDIIDGKNGNIINMSDQEAFKNAMKTFLDNPSFFDTYTNPYKDKIRSFKEQAAELELYYNEVLEKRDV